MRLHSAYDFDKFQTAGILTAETITGFFNGMHHVALLNLAYSANQIIFDVARHFARETQRTVPSLFQKTLPTQPQDPTLQNFRPSANFIKHADRDWKAFKTIAPWELIGYINALCYDYRSLRDAMLDEGYIATHPESQQRMVGLTEESRIGLLTEIFATYMIAVMFGNNAGHLSNNGQEIFPWLYDSSRTEQSKREEMRAFLEDNGINLRSSGGLPDHYLTGIARPIREPSNDTKCPKPPLD